MKILITGNTGFIGVFLTQKLIEIGHEVVGLDIGSFGKENLCQTVIGSVLNLNDIMKAADGVDAIIHLAAKHHDFGISPEEFFSFNVEGTQNLLDCATKLGIKKFIFYSTVAVYGNHKEYTTEETSPEPVSSYGESKLAAEGRVYRWVSGNLSRQAVIIRPTVVFGPENYANMYNLINSIYKKRFLFVGRGDNIKSVAYVENLVEATVFLLERMRAGVDIYNYSDYPQMTIEQIVKIITDYLPCNVPRLKIPLKPAMTATSIFEIIGKMTGKNFPITASRIKKFNTATYHKAEKIREVGFKAPIELSEGFKKMVEWYLNKNEKRRFD